MSNKLTTRTQDFSKWYNEIIDLADLAEHSDVRGCMVIKPYGYSIWENIQSDLDRRFKETGHQNAYFPLFIPKSYLSKEANHVDGFAKECAVVTHYRLKNAKDGSGIIVDEDAKLEEELIVRPTSETIIWNSFKSWVQSYRDLPLKINQWANVVRWEMRTRLFLRTSEFLWQEGHTAHVSKKEAVEEAELMLNVYSDFVEEIMAIPVVKGLKTETERFAGADETYCIEAMLQDGKALQAGTSHFLGQNFAKAFDVQFTSKEGKLDYVWATSWGVSTRLMGALIMMHSDDLGLVLPPKLAPIQLVIVPIYKGEEQLASIIEKLDPIISDLKNAGIRIKIDDDDQKRPGWKFAEYEAKGVPVRIGVGNRDLENNQLEIARRDTQEKQLVPINDAVPFIENLLEEIQVGLLERAKKLRSDLTTEVKDFDTFKSVLKEKGGFISANWDGTKETEEKIKKETKATIRCIPLEGGEPDDVCVYSGNTAKYKVLFAKAY